MTYKTRKSILFFGELPPHSVHGISISNEINVNILKSKHEVTIVEEFSNLRFHNQGSLTKVLSFIKSYLHFFSELLKKRYDMFYGVIYLSTLGIVKNLSTICLFRLFNRKGSAILHFHRSDFDIFLSKKLNVFLFRILNKFTSKFILLSDIQYKQSYISIHKKFVLYNTVEEKYAQIKHVPRGNHELSIVYIGNYIKEKGIFDLLEAAKQYNSKNNPNIKLTSYGNISTDAVQDILHTYNDINITINGPVTGKKKFELLANADVIILPSYNEGMPLILLEALFVGLPVIISNVGFIEDALGPDYPLYCRVGNIQSIIDCIKSFLTMDRKSLSTQLKNRYLKFSYSEHQTNLLRIFQESPPPNRSM